MPDLSKLAACEGNLTVVVETPRGASLKYAYDPSLQVFTLSKALVLGLTYPTDFGFIPSTLAEDGDPLDAFLIHDASTLPGLVVRCRVIGVLEVVQKEAGKAIRNDRIIAVLIESHRGNQIASAGDLPNSLKEEFEKFFLATDELENKKLKFLGWRGPRAARQLIAKAERLSPTPEAHGLMSKRWKWDLRPWSSICRYSSRAIEPFVDRLYDPLGFLRIDCAKDGVELFLLALVTLG